MRTLPAPERALMATAHDESAGSRQGGPRHVTWRVVEGSTSVEMANSFEKRAQPCRIGNLSDRYVRGVTSNDGAPLRFEHRSKKVTCRGETLVHWRFDDARRNIECQNALILPVGIDLVDVLDVHTWNRRNLGDQRVEERCIGHFDQQFVDCHARTTFENLDAGDVSTRSADGGGDETQRSRYVGQPQASDECRSHDDQPSFGRPRFKLRIAWATRCSFSISANRTNPSPPGPNP